MSTTLSCLSGIWAVTWQLWQDRCQPRKASCQNMPRSFRWRCCIRVRAPRLSQLTTCSTTGGGGGYCFSGVGATRKQRKGRRRSGLRRIRARKSRRDLAAGIYEERSALSFVWSGIRILILRGLGRMSYAFAGEIDVQTTEWWVPHLVKTGVAQVHN